MRREPPVPYEGVRGGKRRGKLPKRMLLKRLHDSHHWAARALATGARRHEVAAMTGYSNIRISTLQMDPMFAELVEHYRKQLAEAELEKLLETRDLLKHNLVKAVRLQSDLLDDLSDAHEKGERLPSAVVREHLVELLDRLGFGKAETRVNVDATGLADRMAAARREFLRGPEEDGGRKIRKLNGGGANAASGLPGPALIEGKVNGRVNGEVDGGSAYGPGLGIEPDIVSSPPDTVPGSGSGPPAAVTPPVVDRLWAQPIEEV